MGAALKAISTGASRLNWADRCELAGLVIRSLDPPPEPDVEAAWDEVTERRLREIHEGTVQTIPWEQVRAEIYAQLAAKH